MFGISKKEKYEKNVNASLYALFGDVTGVEPESMIAPKIKILYQEHWNGVIEEGLALGNPPELTALILAVILYQDIIKNQATSSDIEKMKKCILEKNYNDEARLEIMRKMEFSVLIAGSWADHEIERDKFLLAIRDIHRVIFDGDDTHLNDTVAYLINGANRIRAESSSEIL